ncbi:MAG TPA: M1 family metallopeptidase [Anaerolineales bacterium]
MLKHLFPLFLVASLLLACTTLITLITPPTPTSKPLSPGATNTPVPPPPVSQTEAPFNIAWDDRSLFRQNLINSAQNILEGLPGTSIYHIAFSIADPPTRINGMEEVRYTNQETVALTEVDFAVFSEILGGSILINHLTINNQPVTVTHQNGLMRVPLTAPLQPGESVIIHMEFEVTVPALGGDYYYGIFGYNDGILSLAHAYPTILVYNEKGWNNQMPDLDGDPLFSDTSFYLVSVDAPADLVLVASGTEVDRSEAAGRQRVLYADGPARDFYLAASSSFVKQSETIGGLIVNSYAPASLSQYARSALKTAEAAIADFSRRYAPYPYTEFDIAPIITSAGGVEFPGLTSIAKNVYNESDFLEIVVTHEVGHQWFYNLVGNATQDQPWLDESLAEFVTWQYYLDQHGAQGAQSYRDEMQYTWDTLTDENIPIGLPVSAYTSEGYVAIVYGRGPFFLLALRDRMGQETFDQFMSDYTQSYEWTIATTADFKQVAEQTCNCDLTPLFDEWVNP